MDSKETLESKQTEDQTSTDTAPVGNEKAEETRPEANGVNNAGGTDGKPDYAALYREALAAKKRAEDKIVKMKKTSPKASGDDDESDEKEERYEVPDIRGELEKAREQIRAEVVEGEVEDILSEISSDEDERKLIRHIYDNSLVKGGYTRAAIRDDLANAKLLANRDAIVRSNKELAEALKSKAAVQTVRASSSAYRPATSNEPPMSDMDRKILARLDALKKK